MKKTTYIPLMSLLWRRFYAIAMALVFVVSSFAASPSTSPALRPLTLKEKALGALGDLKPAEIRILNDLNQLFEMKVEANLRKTLAWAKCFRPQITANLRSGEVEKAGAARRAILQMPYGLSEQELKTCVQARHWAFNVLVPAFYDMRVYLSLADPIEKTLFTRNYDANGEETLRSAPYNYVNPSPGHLFDQLAALEGQIMDKDHPVRVVAPLSKLEIERALQIYEKANDTLIGTKIKEDRDLNFQQNAEILDDPTRTPEEKKEETDELNKLYRELLAKKMETTRVPLVAQFITKYRSLVTANPAMVFLQVPEDQMEAPGDVRAYEPDIHRALTYMASLNQKLLAGIKAEKKETAGASLFHILDLKPIVDFYLKNSQPENKVVRERVISRLNDYWATRKTAQGSMMMASTLLIGAGCFLAVSQVRRLPVVGVAFEKYSALAGLAFCSVVTGLGMNAYYLKNSNDEYEQIFEEFFSTPGHDGALRELANLEEADKGIFMDTFFLFIGMGVGEGVDAVLKSSKPMSPQLIKVFKNLLPGVKK